MVAADVLVVQRFSNDFAVVVGAVIVGCFIMIKSCFHSFCCCCLFAVGIVVFDDSGEKNDDDDGDYDNDDNDDKNNDYGSDDDGDNIYDDDDVDDDIIITILQNVVNLNKALLLILWTLSISDKIDNDVVIADFFR